MPKQRYPDEEPDFMDDDYIVMSPNGPYERGSSQADIEETYAGNLCERCGQDGHKGNCPHVNELTLKREED